MVDPKREKNITNELALQIAQQLLDESKIVLARHKSGQKKRLAFRSGALSAIVGVNMLGSVSNPAEASGARRLPSQNQVSVPVGPLGLVLELANEVLEFVDGAEQDKQEYSKGRLSAEVAKQLPEKSKATIRISSSGVYQDAPRNWVNPDDEAIVVHGSSKSQSVPLQVLVTEGVPSPQLVEIDPNGLVDSSTGNVYDPCTVPNAQDQSAVLPPDKESENQELTRVLEVERQLARIAEEKRLADERRQEQEREQDERRRINEQAQNPNPPATPEASSSTPVSTNPNDRDPFRGKDGFDINKEGKLGGWPEPNPNVKWA